MPRSRNGMGQFERPDPETVAFFHFLVGDACCERKSMFGCPCAFLNGNMFCGVFGKLLFFRLSDTDKELYLGHVEAIGPFVPVAGRVMREYIVLGEPQTRLAVARELFARSLAHAAGLPAKATKKNAR